MVLLKSLGIAWGIYLVIAGLLFTIFPSLKFKIVDFYYQKNIMKYLTYGILLFGIVHIYLVFDFSTIYKATLSIIGVLAFFKGLVLLFFPESMLVPLSWVNRPLFVMVFLVIIALGWYLLDQALKIVII